MIATVASGAPEEVSAQFAIYEQAGNPIRVTDLAGKAIYINPEGRRALGVADAGENDPADRRVMETGEPLTVEERIGDRAYLTTRSPWRDSAGAVGGIIAISVELPPAIAREADGDRRARELEEHRLRLEMAVDLGQLGLYSRRFDRATFIASETVSRLFGAPAGEYDARVWTERIHPDDREAHERALREAQTGGDFAAEYRVNVGGEWRWISSRGRCLGDDRAELVGVMRDATESRRAAEEHERLREAEERRDLAATAVGLGTWTWDVESQHLFWDDQCRALFEIPPGEPMTMERFWARLLPEDRARVQQEVARAFQAGDSRAAWPENATEYRIRLDGGQIRWIRAAARPVIAPDGRFLRVHGICLDVTDLRETLERDRRLEQRLRMAVEHAGMGTFEFDVDTGDLQWSPTHFTMLGYEPGSFHPTYEAWRSRVFPEDLAEVEARFKRTIREGTAFHAVYRIRRAGDGELRWLEVFAAAVKDGSRVRSVNGIFFDVTERKLAERELAESRERLDLSQRFAGIGSWDYDIVSGRVIWSEQLERIYGMDPGAFDGCLQTWAERVHPDDRARIESFFRDLDGDFDVTYRIVRRNDGQTRWVRSAGSTVQRQGRPVRMIGVNQDVTAQKETELRLRETENRFVRLAESDVVGLMVADFDGRVAYANPLYLRLMGQDARSLADGGVDWAELTPPEWREADQRARAELIERGSCRPYEKEFVQPGGTRVAVLAAAAALSYPSEPPHRFIGIALDLSERKQLERQFLEAQKFESLGALAGGIAHDFNNLLVGVLGNASLAAGMLPPGSDAQPLLEGITQAGERAAQLTRQMLAYSGRGAVVLEPIDLAAQVEDVLPLVRGSLPDRTQLTVASQGSAWVMADRGQVQQIVLNLLWNAVEAVGDPGGRIAIRTGTSELEEPAAGDAPTPGRYAWLEVSDTGSGIDPEIRGRIFDPFFSTKFLGRGLGLAAVAGIVRTHRGAIKVESEPGKGSMFTVYLPAPEERSAATVLVAEGDEAVRRLAGVALERQGFRVLEAATGSDAINRCAEADVVLLDLALPGGDACETLRRMRARRPGLRAVVSGGSEADLRARLAGEPVERFLHKPYDVATLTRALKSA